MRVQVKLQKLEKLIVHQLAAVVCDFFVSQHSHYDKEHILLKDVNNTGVSQNST
jgi:hypothetical protein